eukprot:Sdes_comp20542_c0_seq1m15249
MHLGTNPFRMEKLENCPRFPDLSDVNIYTEKQFSDMQKQVEGIHGLVNSTENTLAYCSEILKNQSKPNSNHQPLKPPSKPPPPTFEASYQPHREKPPIDYYASPQMSGSHFSTNHPSSPIQIFVGTFNKSTPLDCPPLLSCDSSNASKKKVCCTSKKEKNFTNRSAGKNHKKKGCQSFSCAVNTNHNDFQPTKTRQKDEPFWKTLCVLESILLNRESVPVCDENTMNSASGFCINKENHTIITSVCEKLNHLLPISSSASRKESSPNVHPSSSLSTKSTQTSIVNLNSAESSNLKCVETLTQTKTSSHLSKCQKYHHMFCSQAKSLLDEIHLLCLKSPSGENQSCTPLEIQPQESLPQGAFKNLFDSLQQTHPLEDHYHKLQTTYEKMLSLVPLEKSSQETMEQDDDFSPQEDSREGKKTKTPQNRPQEPNLGSNQVKDNPEKDFLQIFGGIFARIRKGNIST